MSSFYDDASLVVIPSGYKTSKVYAEKPTDGSGDLAFTRTGDTATRVNSAGLIEKVRTNFLLRSNTFNTTWTASNASVTSGQSGYDGTTNAWKLTANISNNSHFIFQGFTLSGQLTLSIYAKPSGYNFIMLYAGSYGGRIFDISNGTLGSAVNTAPTFSKIEAAGNGYYRCSITVPSAADFGVFVADSSSTYTFAGNGTNGILIQNAQLEAGDIATDYIPTTTAAVSVGPVANVPRLDYLGSTCPRLLLEPQSLNKCPNSSNYGTNLIDTTVTRNVTTAPTGYVEADLVQDNNALGEHLLGQNFDSITNGLPYTVSCFFKANGSGGRAVIRYYGGTWVYAVYNLANGTVTATDGSITTTIENYGNGWYRCSLTHTAVSDYTPMVTQIGVANASNQFSYQGSSSLGVYFWGFQAEQKSYPTSLIPTVGASATRGADACSKTGISSLIGQTEGTLFVDSFLTHSAGANNEYLAQVNASGSDRILIYRQNSTNKLGAILIRGGAVIYSILTSGAITSTAKVAFAYKSGDFAFYVNGTQVGTSSATYTTPPSMGSFDLDSNGGIENGFYSYNQALLFKTRLTNAEMQELTTL